MPAILVLVLIFIILLILVSCIRIVPQAQAMVVERLGAYLETWNVGIHFKVPILMITASVSDTMDISDRLLVVEQGKVAASYDRSEFKRIVR